MDVLEVFKDMSLKEAFKRPEKIGS